jgi:PAS domain S-box-containing protein
MLLTTWSHSKLKFATRVLLVICLPLACELALSCALIVFAVSAHDQEIKIASEEAIFKESSDFLRELCEMMSIVMTGAVKGDDLINYPEKLKLDSFQSGLTKLQQIVATDRDLSGIASKLRAESETTKRVCAHHAEEMAKRPLSQSDADRAARWKLIDSAETDLLGLSNEIVQTLSELTTREMSTRDAQLENESRTRTIGNFVLLLFALSGVVVSALVALWCVKDMRLAMQLFMSNAQKMSGNEQLLPPLRGSDELSQLDSVFHNVSEAIQSSLKRERAVFEYAADLVCSIDRSGIFQYTNPSSLRLLGYSPQDLAGKSFLDIVAPSDCALADEEFDAASRILASRSFELKLLRADKQEFDSDWTVFWSAVDSSLFCVVSDVTERKNAERLRQDFMSMLTDDIRSPLSAIDADFVEILSGATGAVPDAARAELEICKSTADRLIKLIHDLLRFEKLQTDILQFKFAPIPIKSVIERSIKEVQTLANSADVRLQMGEVNCEAVADENRLMQLLVNLLSNAIRYSPRGGTVSIEIKEMKNFVEIGVADEGPGVPEELREQIFRPFEQAPDSKVTASGGTGLGLAIAKLIVDGHRGEIGVRNGSKCGSVFWFTLPKSGS